MSCKHKPAGHRKYPLPPSRARIAYEVHAELGGAITAAWHFPQDIQATVANHHRPDLQAENGNQITWLVHLADQACLMMGIGRGTDGLAYYGMAYASDRFGLTQKALENIMVDFVGVFRDAKELVGIVEPSN